MEMGPELTVVGPEGVVGVEAFLGSETSGHRAVAQTTCVAYQMRVGVARRSSPKGSAPAGRAEVLPRLLLQISQTSICNLHHSLEQRLCRSLLQSVDRVGSNTVPMTQDVLASLVCARRQGISEAVQKLRDSGLIACERGSITVLDRASLLARACECYVVVQAHIERLLGGSEKRPEPQTKGYLLRAAPPHEEGVLSLTVAQRTQRVPKIDSSKIATGLQNRRYVRPFADGRPGESAGI